MRTKSNATFWETCFNCGHIDLNGGLIPIMDITQKFRMVCPTTECATELYSTRVGIKSKLMEEEE
jgi:hypothetical protein